MNPQIIGWTAAVILVATLVKQVHTQWREQSSRGVSKWLFVGQMAASTGFIIYSWMVRDWVFVTVNVLILTTAITGEIIFLANRRRAAKHRK